MISCLLLCRISLQFSRAAAFDWLLVSRTTSLYFEGSVMLADLHIQIADVVMTESPVCRLL